MEIATHCRHTAELIGTLTLLCLCDLFSLQLLIGPVSWKTVRRTPRGNYNVVSFQSPPLLFPACRLFVFIFLPQHLPHIVETFHNLEPAANSDTGSTSFKIECFHFLLSLLQGTPGQLLVFYGTQSAYIYSVFI